MLNVTREDVDTACAAYARTCQEYPRREGMRVALLATRQLSPADRFQIRSSVLLLRQDGHNVAAELLLKLSGLSDE